MREFGISGLLYKSNVLLYDRKKKDSRESLWSQIELRAIAGPAAQKGLTMKLLPSRLVSWKTWKSNHPNGKVLSNETGYQLNYSENRFEDYHSSKSTYFTVKQLRSHDRLNTKDMMVVVRTKNSWKGYPVKELIKEIGGSGSMTDTISGQQILIRVSSDKNVTVTYPDRSEGPPVSYMYWFSFAASYPKAELFLSSK